MKKIVVLVMAAMMMAGCKTVPQKGRVTAAELDMRSPEQLQAARAESAWPYTTPPNPAEVTTNSLELSLGASDEPPLSFDWSSFWTALPGLKFKLTFAKVEWYNIEESGE